jgi:hypothetical protein
MAQPLPSNPTFYSRLIPAIILRLHYLNPHVLPLNQNLATSYVNVCAQLQLGYGIFAATIPCLKPFIAVWEDCSGENPELQSSTDEVGSDSHLRSG